MDKFTAATASRNNPMYGLICPLYVCPADQFHTSIEEMVDDAVDCETGLSRDDLRKHVLEVMLLMLIPAGNC